LASGVDDADRGPLRGLDLRGRGVSWPLIAAIALGGALGSVGRYAMSSAVGRKCRIAPRTPRKKCKDDAEGGIRAAYRVAARPQSYFIDREGVLRSIQVGQLTDADFERQLAMISGGGSGASGAPARASTTP